MKNKQIPQMLSMNNLFNQYSNGVVKYSGRNFTEYEDLPNIEWEKGYSWDGVAAAATGGLPLKGNIVKNDLDIGTAMDHKEIMLSAMNGMGPIAVSPTFGGGIHSYSNFATGGNSGVYEETPTITTVWYSGANSLGPAGSLNYHTSFRIDDTEYNYGAYYKAPKDEEDDPAKAKLGYVMVVNDSYNRRINYYRSGIFITDEGKQLHGKIEKVFLYELNLEAWQVDLIRSAIEEEKLKLVEANDIKVNAVGNEPRYTYYHYISSDTSIFYEYDWYWHNCTHWFRHILDQALTDDQKAVFRKRLVMWQNYNLG